MQSMNKWWWLALALFVAGVCGGAVSHAADAPPAVYKSLGVSPSEFVLRHPRQPQSIQVLATTADDFSVDLRSTAKFTVADGKMVRVDSQGWAWPLSNGQTTITAAVAGKTLTMSVRVELSPTEPPYSFRHEVMPVLTKAGCNMGACHGYSLGKNGFRLSLRGQDADADYLSISKEAFGRRLDYQRPLASIFVSKPRGDVAHEGGVRYQRDSLCDQILQRWVEQGAPSDLADTAQVTGVRMIPDKLVLRPGIKHRVQLLADYSNGTSRDVTRLGVFVANNTQFATVDDEGLVESGDPGETVIVGRFERKFASTGVIVLKNTSSFQPSVVPQDHLVDRHVLEKLNRLKIEPSAISGDEEFLRRVYLDLIGVQPKPEEIRAFAANADVNKRSQVIEALFDRSEFVDHWSLKWGDLLQNSRNSVSSPSVYLFREFIRSAVASNMPLDEFARRLVTARGGAVDDPASVYFAISKDTNDSVERVTQVFCGVRMLCARCHAHPLENWTQADYYGLASFFNQVSTRPDTRFNAQRTPNAKFVQLNLQAGLSTNPRTNQLQPPRFLGGDEPKLAAGVDRREAYAQWLTQADNPLFARGLVNRLWSYFFHRGIVEPVDDVRSTNPPINPALLEALTADFVQHKFDARHLMRQIVTSRTYQRTSLENASNAHDEQNFSHAVPRRIPAEALLDSLVQGTGVPENIGGAPAGFRAAQLPDANVTSPFLSLFGKPQRMEACECERDNGSNMLQALHMINGNSILSRVSNPNGRPAQLLKQKLSDEERINELYLWTLARSASANERRVGVEFLASYGDKQLEALQDMMWALLNSKDFLLVH